MQAKDCQRTPLCLPPLIISMALFNDRFGTNQLVGLNERLGALDRCQGGFFTNQQDASPTDTKFNIPVGRCNHARSSGVQQ